MDEKASKIIKKSKIKKVNSEYEIVILKRDHSITW